MCYLKGEFRVGGSDVLIGEFIIENIAEPIQIWMSASQFEYWETYALNNRCCRWSWVADSLLNHLKENDSLSDHGYLVMTNGHSLRIHQ